VKDEEFALVAGYKERFIWLDGEINPKVAYQFKRMLSKLNRLKCAPITFYIRGPGGNSYSAFHIMNEINNSDSPVATVAHGYVGSGCFTITQAGAHRLALAGTKFIFHLAESAFEGKYSGIIEMTQSWHIDNLERLKLIDGAQLCWFSKKGRPIKKIFDLFKAETVLTVPKARKLHLIDDYYKEKDFLKDRRIARKLIRARDKP